MNFYAWLEDPRVRLAIRAAIDIDSLPEPSTEDDEGRDPAVTDEAQEDGSEAESDGEAPAKGGEAVVSEISAYQRGHASSAMTRVGAPGFPGQKISTVSPDASKESSGTSRPLTRAPMQR